ncbi:MAG TPA: hypothetical protein LFW10_02630 [Rickettsia endosymbiont of Diachasma alloeum]|nr:hypothetical protein [Rickettsia endosymbiont of Diachasma alloeum]
MKKSKESISRGAERILNM